MKNTLILILISLAGLCRAQHTGCFGITPELSDSDRIALRLYPSAPVLKWYDFSTYRFKGHGKQWVWGVFAVAGILHGSREAYHADPTVFERRFNAAPVSFFGSEQWKRQYCDRNPETMPHKPNIWNPVRDYWHFSGTTKNYLFIGGAVTIGASKQPVKYRVIDTLISVLSFSATASLTYTLLR